jgi:hypothetical protein
MVCILTAWSLFQNRIYSDHLEVKITICKQTVNYFKSISSDFICNTYFNEELDWDIFLDTFAKLKKQG